MVRRRIDVRYDPFDISIIKIWHEGKFQRKAENYMPEFTLKLEGSPSSSPG